MHEFITLMRENPFGTFIILLAVLWTAERVVFGIINRNRPQINCDCDCHDEEE